MAVERFPALSAVPGVVHGFTGRIPGIDVAVGRAVALERLTAAHEDAIAQLGLGGRKLITADQVHGADVAVVDAASTAPVPNVDGLMTADPQVVLGVYVADCGPVYLVDPVRRVIALLHSGRKGTESGITTAAILLMVQRFGSDPSSLILQLGPCIRPPLYEIDFASEILRQAREAGVREVHDCATCTGSNTDRYYSYRVEKGRTGRMLAVLALQN
jgi:copper oxidase (laccase) domain-containing protein